MWTVNLSSNINVECVDLRDNYLLRYLRVPPAKNIMFQHELLEPGTWELGLEEMETQRESERNWDGERKEGET